MSKDFFQRNVDLMNELRAQQFKVKEYLARGKYRMKQKFFNKGKKHYDFDLNSQEYFHEELYDLCFESSEIQQGFINGLLKMTQEPVQYRNKRKYQVDSVGNRINQSQARHILYRFFNNRVYDLQYEKYLVLQRLHNIQSQQQIAFVKSRITLIDKQIQMSLNRSDRLSCQDYFEETYTLGGKPVPVNQNGQAIYKYLEEEDCWFSNIHRDDILIYTRNKLFKKDLLEKHFIPIFIEQKALIKTFGIDLLVQNEEQLAKERLGVQDHALKKAKKMISLFERELESISPGNLVQKENINTFIYNVFGVQQNQLPLNLPLYPATDIELLENYNHIIPYFFKSIELKEHRQLISLMPKLNNFCAILFKYQNKEILQGKQQIKLGLEDEVDIKKELHTMLEQIWVNKYVKTDFDRFNYRYRLQPVDWPLDTISEQHQRHKTHSEQTITGDTSVRELINIVKSSNYGTFRKHLKKHSQIILGRVQNKYYHMQKINRYNVLTDQQQTLEQLGGLFRIKFNQKQTNVNSLLKQNAKGFFQAILNQHQVINPVQIQLQEMMRTIQIRETRVKLINIFNGMRCYHRNLAFDLRVISGMTFQFSLDDQLLINSNKQTFQNFQKAVKETQTFFSRESNQTQPINLAEEDFVQRHTYQKTKLFKKDKVTYHFFGEEIPHILVSHGKKAKNKILYQIALQDMQQVQKRILQQCTHYINRYQRYIKLKSLDQIVDRVDLLSKIYELELNYQFQKFKLIEAYYYIYQNTKQPLNAFKLSQCIVELILKSPLIDYEETSFVQSYELAIEAFKQQQKIVNLLIQQLSTVQQQKCKSFHDKFARSLNIPLTLQAYLYGDLQKRPSKQGAKLQRMNSFASKISKDSRNKDEKNLKMDFEIKQHQVEEGSSEEDSFDLENYDEYLLRKNMDAIFDDMMGADENGHVKEASPVNSIAIQNLVVNPKFEGGPHIKTKIFPQVHITSNRLQNLINFNEILFVIGNIRNLIQSLRQQFQTQYGFCSKLYQNGLIRLLTKKMYRICLTPDYLPPRWNAFESEDPYFETVTKSMRYYEEMMASSLQPPSNVQLAMYSTFQKHHQKMPPYSALQYFDYHSIDSLIKLKKPINTFRYKQHNLGINFIELLSLQQKLWTTQLQRRQLSRSYQNLAKHCDIILQKSLTEYTLSGQSDIFWATQQLKMYNQDASKYPVFNDTIDEIRRYLNCEIADVQLFQKYIQISKKYVENLIIMKYEIDRPFINTRIDKSRILAPNDPKDIKKLKGRITSMLSIRATEVLKQNNFLKLKTPIKTILQIKLKELIEGNFEDRIDGRDKMSGNCIAILTTKYKKYLQLKLIDSYSNDLLLTANKFLVGTQTCKIIKKINNYVLSIPFLSKLFISPNQDKMIDQKIFYDQAKHKKLIPLQYGIISEGQIKNIFYIYSLQQYLQQWAFDNNSPILPNIQKFDCRQKVSNINPPASKQQIFKWVFQIPDLQIEQTERESLKHLINLFHPFTGKLTQFGYKSSSIKLPQPQRNKYLVLLQYYRSIVDYIEANIFLISLQIQEEILNSLQTIVRKHINFEQRYFLTDENSIRQTINSLENKDLSIVYNYVINFAEIHKDVQKKIFDKGYIDKKQHWVVHDEITDFILSKIQGYGLLRQSYMPLYEDLKNLKNLKTSPVEYLKLKTSNIYKCMHISSFQAYLNEINEKDSDYFAYFNKINQWLSTRPKLQKYALSNDDNNRVDVDQVLWFDQSEKERFANGIYKRNSNTLIDRLKHLMVVPGINLSKFLEKIIYKKGLNEDTPQSLIHHGQFLQQGINTFKLMGQQNRLKLFARVRYHHQLSDNYISTRPSTITLLQKQTLKSSFYDLLLDKKSIMLASILFTGRVGLPANAKTFKEVYMELKEVNQIFTHNLYENLERYKEENKIQFSKTELALIGKNEGGNDDQYNRAIKQVLSLKLLKQQFKVRIISQSIRILKFQRLPKQQAKKIINTSLIPRVHLITSYSSPLITDRKTYISQQYKLAFLQAFINRFRNKVSRVDLLSSGYGFVITVPDLEDCVNYMNKLLFTFAEKEFRFRIQTFSQYYDILIEAVNDKNRVICEQTALITHLQHKNQNLLQAEYLSKVTKLLHQKTVLQDRLRVVENNLNGLEDRVRKVVQIQYDKKIERLEKQNQQLRMIFSRVKHLHITNTKQAAKNNFLEVVNYYRERINDLLNKKIDFSISFDDAQIPKDQRAKQQDNKQKYKSQDDRQQTKYVTEDLQKCKLGQDILFDPYYATKLINKMRIFNLFKMGSKRLKFDEDQQRKNQELVELHKIQDAVISQAERDVLVRNQLSKVQEELSKKCLELQKLKQTFDIIQNQKTKLKILMQSKDKKIEQKQRQIQQLKKKMSEKQSSISNTNSQKDKTPTEQLRQTAKLAMLRKEKKVKKMDRSAFVTNIDPDPNRNTISIYERFQLSNKDSTWREKCQQLYLENKKLQSQLQRMQGQSRPQTPKKEGVSLNMRNRRESMSQSTNKNQGRFPNISFKYNLLKQGQY